LITRTANKFAGFFQSDFWQTLIFQASAQEPAVRHAVIALSSAHRSDQLHGSKATAARDKFDGERFTLQQYNKAIQHLRTDTTQTSHSLRVALITCTLFVILEYLRGQYQIGSEHLRYGMKLLIDISAPAPRSAMEPNLLCPNEDFAYNALVDAYARLGTQSAMFGHVPAHMCLITRHPQSTFPYVFTSLQEARRSLDDHLNRVHCLEKHVRNHRSPTNDQDIVNTQSRTLADLALWRKTYTASLTRLEIHNTPGRDKFCYLLLRVYHEMATIMASVCLSESKNEEMIFDLYTENFITIMSGFLELWKNWTSFNFREEDLPKLTTQSADLEYIFRDIKSMSDMNGILETSLLEIFEKSASISVLLQVADCGKDGFTVETGYIPPLYYTALKCRVPRIRRQAARTLRAAPHREGVWNGPLLAKVLDEVISIEEGDLYATDASVHSSVGYVLPRPEDLLVPKVSAEARVSDVSVILPNDVAGDTYISYRKRGLGGEWVTYKRKVGV
jgi:hypothetical protein